MHNKRVVIIGSGLGGLSCGVILAKNGYDVTILEQGIQIGGCLQCFSRKGVKFETGMHFIGSADKGQTLDKLLRYLEIRNKIELSKLDTDCYESVYLKGKEYHFANGRDTFISKMTEYFPEQHENLKKYFDLIDKVATASSLHTLKYAESDSSVNAEYQLKSINEVIEDVITDPLLAKVLVGNLPLYAAEKDKTPFSSHAFIMDFYNQSSFRIVGGSDKIATALVDVLKKYGGKIYTHSKVTKIVCDATHATSVEVNNKDVFEADYFISDAHPIRTLELLDTKLIRPAFRNRINSMSQTVGGFSVYLKFKKDSLPYMNHNFYAYNDGTPWNCEIYTPETWPKGFLYMHFCQEECPKYATTGAILSYMQMDDVKQWVGTSIGHRGADYEKFKRDKAEKLIDSLEKCFPDIREHIECYYTSTPLTYIDYTGTEGGSMYGIAKNVMSSEACRIPQRTKVPNLFLTGQNINSHGMLGVLVGTIVTCSEFLTAKKIYQQIIESNNG